MVKDGWQVQLHCICSLLVIVAEDLLIDAQQLACENEICGVWGDG